MSDPFGLDDVDFDVDIFMKRAWEAVMAQLIDETTADGDALTVGENPMHRKSLSGNSLYCGLSIDDAPNGAVSTGEEEGDTAYGHVVTAEEEERQASAEADALTHRLRVAQEKEKAAQAEVATLTRRLSERRISESSLVPADVPLPPAKLPQPTLPLPPPPPPPPCCSASASTITLASTSTTAEPPPMSGSSNLGVVKIPNAPRRPADSQRSSSRSKPARRPNPPQAQSQCAGMPPPRQQMCQHATLPPSHAAQASPDAT